MQPRHIEFQRENIRHPDARALSMWLIGILLSLVAFGAAAAPRELWRLDRDVSSSIKAQRPGMHPLQFDARALAEWPVGEAGELALPGGRSFPIVADRIEQHAGGNRSWIGRYEVDGTSHVAVLTYGPAGLVGEVRTPDGLIVITMDGGQPLLVDTREAGWQVPPMTESDALAPTHLPEVMQPAHPAPAHELLKATPSPQTTVDVLFVYTDGLVAREGSVAGALLRLNQLIATANLAYADSEIAITLRLVHAVQVAYTDANSNSTALDDLTAGRGVFAAAQGTLRNRYGADVVVLARPFRNPEQQGCGVAWVGGYGNNGAGIGAQSGIGFGVVSDGRVDAGNGGGYYYCPNSAFPHEVGHLMGALHDIQTVNATRSGTGPVDVGAYSYSYGYTHGTQFNATYGMNACTVTDGSCFGTVMSYMASNQLLRFANPLQSDCANGQGCGSAAADITRTFNNTRNGVASWRPTKLPFIGTQQGTPQTASPSAAFAQPLRVVVRDAANVLVPGVTVRFAAPAAGASAVLSATSVITDANGVAQVTATANATAGTYVITATAHPDFVATTFSFQLTNQAATTVPGAPVIIAVVAGNASATVMFTAPGSDGGTAITGYTVTSSPAGGIDSNAGTTALSHTMTGLTNGVAYTFTVRATNARGTGAPSAASSNVTPSGGGVLRAVTVTKAGSGSGVVTGNIPGIQCGVSCSSAFLDGTVLTLTAAPSPGAVFVGWLGACTGRAPCALNLNRDTTVSAAFAPSTVSLRVDVDGNGSFDALTDGIMMVRYLFGVTGSQLTAGVIGPGPLRSTPTDILQQLDNLRPLLDIDGNGQTEALTDGMLLLRYLFGLRGAPLVAGVVGQGATRTTAAQIETWIRSLLP